MINIILPTMDKVTGVSSKVKKNQIYGYPIDIYYLYSDTDSWKLVKSIL